MCIRDRYFTKYHGKTIPKFAVMFLAEINNEKIELSSEHDRYEWLSFYEAHKRISNSQMKEVLKKADEFLSGRGIPR